MLFDKPLEKSREKAYNRLLLPNEENAYGEPKHERLAVFIAGGTVFGRIYGVPADRRIYLLL
jgi:hypothetical protein